MGFHRGANIRLAVRRKTLQPSGSGQPLEHAHYNQLMIREELESALEGAALKLLAQLEFSNGFTMVGDSRMAEASLVVQIASQFSQRDAAVWAESPFESPQDEEIDHIDLLVDLSAKVHEQPDVLLVEAKAGASGKRSETIKQVLGDIQRLRSWSALDILSRPLFFYWAPVERVRGVIAVIFTEKLERRDRVSFELKEGSLARWWEETTGTLRASGTLPSELKQELDSATWRRVLQGPVRHGAYQTFVAYAVFELDLPAPNELRKTSEHEAAHAVLALSFGFPVVEMRLCASGDQKGQFSCDWQKSRGSVSDSELLTLAAAMAYAGAMIDFKYRAKGESFQDIMNRLPTDTDRLQEVRETAVKWGLAQNAQEASQFTDAGYQLALQLVPENFKAISDLAEMLEENEALDRDFLSNWFDGERFIQESETED